MATEIYAPGEKLMTQGEKGDKFFIITSGVCEILATEQGKTRLIAVLEEGDHCGEQALLKEATRNATVQAKTEIQCLSLDREDFRKILKDTNVRFAKRDAKRAAIDTEILDNFEIDKSKMKPKTDEESEWLLNCIKNNLLFQNMTPSQKKELVEYMYLETVDTKAALITQGEEGNTFYVINKGSFNVSINGIQVATCVKGECTGDLALIYNAPRSATVIAKESSEVWCIDRKTFRKVLMEHHQKQTSMNIEFLKGVPLLGPLIQSEVQLLDQALQEKPFAEGDVIFKQGDVGALFYIIKSGEVEGVITGENAETFKLTAGDFFGERALLKNEPRAATMTALTEVVCLWLSREDFADLLGPLQDILDRQTEEYKKPADKRKLICATKQSNEEDYPKLEYFIENTIGVLGTGAFGTVTLVLDREKQESYALKAIKKIQIVDLGQQTHITNEKKIMQMLDNRFLVNLRRTYKDAWRVYFLLDVCLGGELFTILRKMRSFDESTARFFAGCVTEAFDYMHTLDVIYRDLKPENLVLDSTGYLKITDFGFAKVVPNKTFTLCGTPDYLAPEIVTGQGHGKPVDWWTLGVLIYEMIASYPPFFDDEPMMTYRRIISCKLKFPKCLSSDSKTIISRFLNPHPMKRLGVIKGGADLVRSSTWFADFPWEQLREGEMKCPIATTVRSYDDMGNFDKFEQPGGKLKFDSTKYDMSWDEVF
eukprot:TRINITY_DN0_c4_g1_i11.p1 TRINITY_DN0_c4_g1~~TRINITY_DN0_c4_g1_i11.p1  ORF type:complete len:710 (+),score=129.25 TRINITY_DN0_c4_g1_i11:306-2435(+)